MIDCCVDGQFWFVCHLNSLYIPLITKQEKKKHFIFLELLLVTSIFVQFTKEIVSLFLEQISLSLILNKITHLLINF